MSGSTSEHHENEASLAAIADARRAAADRLVTPWWYHPVLGLLFIGYVAAVSLGGTLVMLGGLAVFFGGLYLLMAAYRRTTGIWLWGYQGGRATPWAYAMGAVGGLGAAGAIGLSYADVGDRWIWTVAVVMGLTIVVMGRQYDRVLRADLRGEL